MHQCVRLRTQFQPVRQQGPDAVEQAVAEFHRQKSPSFHSDYPKDCGELARLLVQGKADQDTDVVVTAAAIADEINAHEKPSTIRQVFWSR